LREHVGLEEKLPSGFLLRTVEGLAGLASIDPVMGGVDR
jgi:hypothetical protein